MNLNELATTVDHLKKTCTCPQCNSKYEDKDISVLATTTIEGLLEMKCPKCQLSTLVTVLISPVLEVKEKNSRTHRGLSEHSISNDELLDIKNFLSNFDGDFKKIFEKKS